MNKQITAQIHVLLKACIIVNAAGDHHVFFDFSGHVESISVRAYGSDTSYAQEAPDLRHLIKRDIYFNPSRLEQEGEARATRRILKELKQATEAVLGLLKMEVAHVA